MATINYREIGNRKCVLIKTQKKYQTLINHIFGISVDLAYKGKFHLIKPMKEIRFRIY